MYDLILTVLCEESADCRSLQEDHWCTSPYIAATAPDFAQLKHPRDVGTSSSVKNCVCWDVKKVSKSFLYLKKYDIADIASYFCFMLPKISFYCIQSSVSNIKYS